MSITRRSRRGAQNVAFGELVREVRRLQGEIALLKRARLPENKLLRGFPRIRDIQHTRFLPSNIETEAITDLHGSVVARVSIPGANDEDLGEAIQKQIKAKTRALVCLFASSLETFRKIEEIREYLQENKRLVGGRYQIPEEYIDDLMASVAEADKSAGEYV